MITVKREIETVSYPVLFDLSQQIMDDIKNKNFKNGFIIYLNNGKLNITSAFDNHDNAKKTYNALIENMNVYINTLLSNKQ